ncbi:hypothetical protein OUZ56_026447 [Daphnia magna]|uniref:Uncharacterized protein n=1 Tax=Daphnia magna TaxID=35525 RepID=A0ABQ9ZLS4_9CRUS|nr:hypothetical protein OUZ56_026447 [Daphnia magna]
MHVSGSDLASQDILFDGAPVGLDTDANVSNESESEGDNSFLFFDNSSIWDLELEKVADGFNDLDVDDDQDDLTDWYLNLEDVDQGLSVIDGTPRKVNTVEVSPGRYFEFNVLDGITSSLDFLNASFESHDVNLKIKIGCDGMPASTSTNFQFWLILGLIVLEGAKPFEIGV